LQRIEQLKQCFNHMLEQNDDVLVFFGGDLPLRDTEVSIELKKLNKNK